MRPKETDLIDGLTPKQLQVLRHIAAFQGSQRYSPTIADLASQLRLSRSTVFEHLGELQRKSLLTTSPGKARSLKLTAQGRRLLKDTQACESDQDEPSGEGIPLVGQVAAGLPLEAVENRDDLSLRSCFGTSDELFALRVRGDSMIEENIRPGDYVICRRASRAENGQIVVALIDEGEATLKRFYKEGDRARLQPANERYEPIYSDNCRIEAVVVGLVRKF
ncbi:MAG: transcriptional repressor LexA [Planctomycetes bacterium]|jgi:repressor LexA|nr:transcriptional repressor LexA [Planctomycetota bacterium]